VFLYFFSALICFLVFILSRFFSLTSFLSSAPLPFFFLYFFYISSLLCSALPLFSPSSHNFSSFLCCNTLY
jgi:hypothetical protein